MKVFISWSGNETKSLAVAKALDAWLPTVINAVEPWISSRGLSAGLKWNQQLEKELDDTSFGIIVVTPWNQHAQWLNFEAGALSKRVHGSEARVAPLLIDFDRVADLSGPLSSYQAVLPDRDGFLGLVSSINQALDADARTPELLARAFDVCWPSLESMLKEINESMKKENDPSEAPVPQPISVENKDMLSEILEAIREMSRSDTRLKNAIKNVNVTPKRSTRVEKALTNADKQLLKSFLDHGQQRYEVYEEVRELLRSEGDGDYIFEPSDDAILIETPMKLSDLTRHQIQYIVEDRLPGVKKLSFTTHGGDGPIHLQW